MVDENPHGTKSDAELVRWASETGNRDSAYIVEVMRRLMVEIRRSNRTMTVLTWVICICTLLLFVAASVQIFLQLNGC